MKPIAFALTLAVCLLAGASVASAAPKKGASPELIDTVRYSYEKWSRAGQKRYVLVPLPSQIKPGTLQERVRALFKTLVGKKRNTYGDARISFQPDAAKTGVVYVYLDAAKKQYNPIVMAETTYTFTENGATKVIFPKQADGGWTRANVPFPAYVLSVPLWQALPPAKLGGALVELNDGSLLRAEAAKARLEKGDKTLVDDMWRPIEEGPANAALAAVKAAPLLKLADLEARLLPVLKKADKRLREAAMDGLAGRDNGKVNAALREIMDTDPEAALKDKAAGMLSKSKDPKYSVAAQYHAMRSADPKVVAAAATGLGDSKEPEAGKQLLAALGNGDAAVREAVIKSLIKRGDHGAMVARLDDAKLDASVKLEVARALAADKDKKAKHAALMHLAVHGSGDDSAGAAAGLPAYDSAPTYAALGAALKHKEAATRRAAASALSRLGKTAGLEPLAAADIEDAESGEAVLTAIRDIYNKQDIDYVLKGTKSKDPVLRRSAVATLGAFSASPAGKRHRNTIIERLRPLSKDKQAIIRASAARSFGVMGGKQVRDDLLGMAKDDAVEVKREVARGLRAFPGKDTNSLLLGFATDKDATTMANAIESLGMLKNQEALDPIVNQLNNKDARVRAAATGALVSIGAALPKDKRNPLLSFFSERLFDKDGAVRLKAIAGLRLVKDPRTVTALAALLQDPIIEVRKATLLAMADTGDKGAVEVVAGGLDDDDKTVRKTALDCLRTLKHKSAIKVLEEYAGREKDKGLADEARSVIKALKGR